MSYPRIPLMTLDEFVQRIVDDYGGELRESEMQTPRGEMPLRYLHRANGDGDIFYTILPDVEGDARLTPDQMRSMISNLDLDAHMHDLGLTIMM